MDPLYTAWVGSGWEWLCVPGLVVNSPTRVVVRQIFAVTTMDVRFLCPATFQCSELKGGLGNQV